MSDFIIRLLQKWAAGKPLPKHQTTELQHAGYLNNDGTITTKGANTLTRKA